MSSPALEVKEQMVEKAGPFRFGWRFVWRTDENGQQVQVRQPLTYEDVLHPQEEDFIVQNSAHNRDVVYLYCTLRQVLHGRKDIRVWSDLRTDWEVGDIEPHGPDVGVFEGAQKEEPQRGYGTYKVKNDGARPILVIEVTSESTRSQDLNDKVVEYYKAGVPFYAIVDYLPEKDHTMAVVFGYRATPEGYLRLAPDERGWLWMEPVGLWLAWKEGRTVCYDSKKNRILDTVETKLRLDEADRRSEELEEQVEEAVTARQHAEKRAADEERQRQDAEKRAADEERQRQDAEKRASDLANRMADLEAELRRLRGDS